MNDASNRTTPEDAPEADLALEGRWISMIDTALRLQAPVAAKYVASLRAKNPEASDAQLMDGIEKRFLWLMTATGAGVGGVAALPGIGTAAAVGLTIGDGLTFGEACAFLTLAAADIHGIDMHDQATRRIVLMGVLGGERGEKLISKSLGKHGVQWETVLAGSASNSVLPRLINKEITRYIRRRVLARTGGVWMGRLMPFGIGAVVGGVGNRAIASSMLEAVRDIFGSVSAATIEGEIREG